MVVPFLSTVSSRFISVLALSQFHRPDYLGERNRQGLLEKGNDPLRDIGNQKWFIEREFKHTKSQCCPSYPFTVCTLVSIYDWYEN